MLPGFVVSFFEKSSIPFSVGRPVQTVNGYCFYESDAGIVFSLNNVYLRLYDDYQKADVYILQKNENSAVEFDALNLLLLAYKYRMIATGNILMHSAAVIHCGSGILFCGMSGAGKSTQAGLWNRHLKAWALNFDQPCVLMDKDDVVVHGSPWSGKERCYINSCAPLKAIVFVEQADVNEALLLSEAEAFSKVYLNNYVYPISEEIERLFIANTKKLVEKIPVYTLKCTVSEDAVKVMYGCLFGGNYEAVKGALNMVYKRKDCFEMKKVADDFLVIPRGTMSIDYSAVLVFNESGAFLWDVLKKEVGIEELTKALAVKYSLDVTTAHDDAVKFIDKMVENDLVDVKG